MGEKPKSGGVWPTVKPFVNGGASGMLATCVIQPIDMIKVTAFYHKIGFIFYGYCLFLFLRFFFVKIVSFLMF